MSLPGVCILILGAPFFANLCGAMGQVSNLCRSQCQPAYHIACCKLTKRCWRAHRIRCKPFQALLQGSCHQELCLKVSMYGRCRELYTDDPNIILSQVLVSVMLPHPQQPQSCSPYCKKVWVGWPQSCLRTSSAPRSNQSAKCTGLRQIYSMTVQWCLTAYRRLCRKRRGWCY